MQERTVTRARLRTAFNSLLPLIAARQSVKLWPTIWRPVRNPSCTKRRTRCHLAAETRARLHEKEMKSKASIAKAPRHQCNRSQARKSIAVGLEELQRLARLLPKSIRHRVQASRFDVWARTVRVACLVLAPQSLPLSRCLAQVAKKLLRTEIKRTRKNLRMTRGTLCKVHRARWGETRGLTALFYQISKTIQGRLALMTLTMRRQDRWSLGSFSRKIVLSSMMPILKK